MIIIKSLDTKLCNKNQYFNVIKAIIHYITTTKKLS